MKLYHRNKNNVLKLIAECETLEDCYLKIDDFLDSINFKSFYKRHWSHDDVIIVDYGSYVEFLEIHE